MYRFEIVEDRFREHPMAGIKLPKRATKEACAYDFYAPVDACVFPHTSLLIYTDVKLHIPSGYAFIINVRSSMGGLDIRLANTQGWIESDYYNNAENDGNIGIYLKNDSNEPFYIHQGDRIVQGMIIRFYTVDDDDADQERTGGFGSTGK